MSLSERMRRFARFGAASKPGERALGAAPVQPSSGAQRPKLRAAAEACSEGGFTLIELMVVLVILGLLAGLVGPQLFGKVDSSKAKVAETQVKMLHGALQAYRLDVGRLPTTAEGLGALVRPPPGTAEFWSGPYLDGEVPEDPWRAPYRYLFPADTLQGFALYSLGADSKHGGQGADADVGYIPAQPSPR